MKLARVADKYSAPCNLHAVHPFLRSGLQPSGITEFAQYQPQRIYSLMERNLVQKVTIGTLEPVL